MDATQTPLPNLAAPKTSPAHTLTLDSDDWRPEFDRHDEGTTKAADACALFVAEIRRNLEPRWLTISGPTGCGKTHLARMTLAAAFRHSPEASSVFLAPFPGARRPRCVFFTAPRFAIQTRADPDLPEYLADDFLVVVDDLGADREYFDTSREAFYRLANARARKWTLWTTNLTFDQISQQLDDRIASRLIRGGNRAVRMASPDYARRKFAAVKKQAEAAP